VRSGRSNAHLRSNGDAVGTYGVARVSGDDGGRRARCPRHPGVDRRGLPERHHVRCVQLHRHRGLGTGAGCAHHRRHARRSPPDHLLVWRGLRCHLSQHHDLRGCRQRPRGRQRTDHRNQRCPGPRAAVGEAALIYPRNGQAGVDPTKAFTWTAIRNADSYDLTVGTTPYGTNLVNSGIIAPTRSTYATPVLPGGKTLYATLYTEVNGTWGRHQSITFTTGPAMAVLTNPVNGQSNVVTPAAFTWTTVSAAQNYDLTVGTTLYGTSLVNSGIIATTRSTYTTPVLPGGKTLYATLYTEINNKWVYQEVAFIATHRQLSR
jgi:hypothetical protein